MTDAGTGPESKDVGRWIGEGAHPVSVLDSRASLAEVRPLAAMVGDARIVALGASTRASRELSVATSARPLG
ncbi:hypothetical protein [Streptomyces sp. H27-C3]|uniref:hypothetical protein n=1 Tax=Streptomyces sp. H27-C3 TaxID=3046305 RepID=UPI0024BA5E4D|nr:hypothetical protein [Streptomyces sp. H27-C3]MDJ0462572.1 hypothetical protein [Streptomyces sp. H27-C3]